MTQLVRAPVNKAEDPGSNPGPSENFPLKLTTSQNILLTVKIKYYFKLTSSSNITPKVKSSKAWHLRSIVLEFDEALQVITFYLVKYIKLKY